jgi:hypothetical protein
MRLVVAAGLLCLSACAPTPRPQPTFGPQVIAPAAAVLAAADAAPRGYPGRFGFVVVAAAMVGPRLFLNSYSDYRDQRNLSVAIEPRALRALRATLGGDPLDRLKGRKIEVDGVAQRVRIDFTVGGRPSGKYYYQTHVIVSDPRQLTVLD